MNRLVARARTLVAAAVIAAGVVHPAAAQFGPRNNRVEAGTPSSQQVNLLEDVRFDQKLDAQLPLDILFRDETGKTVKLGDYFGTRPVILALVYYECPMLCSQVLTGLTSALDILKFNAGQEFDVVAVSFNPKEGPGLAATSTTDILAQIRYDQRLDEQVPADLLFRDDTGRAVEFGSYFGTRPIVLALVYYECPMLCSQVLTGLTRALEVMTFNPGQEFEVVVVSFNPKEGPLLAGAKKRSYMERYNRPGTERGWHFLTGPPESIERLTKAVGFNYVWDERTKQFAHAAGIVLLTPHGKVSKYFYGIDYSARDLRLGIVEASQDRIGTPVDNLLLYCYHYDPLTGKYGFVAMRTVQLGGVVTIAGMLTFWIVMWRRERALRPADAARHA